MITLEDENKTQKLVSFNKNNLMIEIDKVVDEKIEENGEK